MQLPSFTYPDNHDLRTKLLWYNLVFSAGACGFYSVSVPLLYPGIISRAYLTTPTTVILLALMWLAKHNQERLAGILYILLSWTALTTSTLLGAGGLYAPGHGIYFFLITSTGMLEPLLMMGLTAIYLIIWAVCIYTGHTQGFYEGMLQHVPMSIWTGRFIFLSTMAGLTLVIEKHMRGAYQQLVHSQKELDALSQQQRVLFDVSNSSTDFIVYTDPEHRILFANTALCRLLDTDRFPQKMADIYPEHAAATFQDHTVPMVFEYGHWRGETVLLRADGSEVPVDQVVISHKDEHGNVTHISMVMRDISQQKDIQKELQRSNDDLHQFALIASHDLQAPLRKVVTFTQLLLEEHSTSLNEEGRQFARFAADSAAQMRDLIRDLLAYSTIDGGEHNPTSVALHTALVRTKESLVIDLQGDGVALTWDDELPTVWCVPQQLALVLQNLISNAITYVPADTQPQVHISARSVPEGVEISVQDNGIGIPAEYREGIFEIFKRLHARHRYPGTGIGLAICRRVLDRHGGWIRAEGRPEGGTIFRFLLPHSPLTKG